MNYRHIYHAGNFADVLKHAVLALIVEHLKLKPQPFRVVDTHAGVGRYDLSSEQAQKTGEWRDGIGRLVSMTPPPAIAEILAPYLDVVRGENAAGDAITRYPGSPLVARRLMRREDRLVVNEAHAEDAAALEAFFAKDPVTKVMTLDGWTMLKAVLPPKERRGVVLIDPPFEQAGEFKRLVEALAAAHRRFATGTVVIWYPVKDQRQVRKFLADAAALAVPKILVAELLVAKPHADGGLSGTGLLIVNPPFTLEAKLAALLPFLANALARDRAAESNLVWLSGERVTSS